MIIFLKIFTPYNKMFSLREEDDMPFSINCVFNSNLLEHLKYLLDIY